MSRRLHVFLALVGGIAVTIVLFTPSWGQNTAHYPDIGGVVKSVDAENRRIVLVDDKGHDIIVDVAPNTTIRLETPPRMGRGDHPARSAQEPEPPRLDLGRVKPGTRIIVGDIIEAASIRMMGQTLGTLKSVDPTGNRLVLTQEGSGKDLQIALADKPKVVLGRDPKGQEMLGDLAALQPGSRLILTSPAEGQPADSVIVERGPTTIRGEFLENFTHNLFKPLLLFFYLGFIVPILKVEFEFPHVIYQGLVIFLLVAIGWHGGEELSRLRSSELASALGFMGVGFATNFVIGILAYLGLSAFTPLRRIDRATVAGYYGSDSAGTFVTCVGALVTAGIAYEAYMPVMLAIMEIPGCLVALYLVSRLRHGGMDARGNMPGEPNYDANAKPVLPAASAHGHGHAHGEGHSHAPVLEQMDPGAKPVPEKVNGKPRAITGKLLHEVFLNQGLFLLFGGILIGFASGLQGKKVTIDDDHFFNDLFQGILCLFLLEMGMTASRKLKDLKTAGIGYVLFGLLAPNVFATLGMIVAHAYGHFTHTPFLLGTYVLFAVLCGAASYIAVPAVQRLAIPEASPTLPLAASLGLTFSYNVTIGIPVYIEIAKYLMRELPV